MATERVTAAREAFDNALCELIRASMEDDENAIFVQDWVLITASESMVPGKSMTTYMLRTCRHGMSKYAVNGLLLDGLNYFKTGERHE